MPIQLPRCGDLVCEERLGDPLHPYKRQAAGGLTRAGIWFLNTAAGAFSSRAASGLENVQNRLVAATLVSGLLLAAAAQRPPAANRLCLHSPIGQ